MNKTPKVSVLMSVFNGQAWLDLSIQSILDQTFEDFEFIIVNDGSTDATLDILNKWCSKDKRIIVINKNNTGLADSLNHGLSIARGSWLARQDADDISDPRRLIMQYEYCIREKADFVGSDSIVIDENGKPLKNYSYPSSHNKILRNMLNGTSFFPHTSVFLKTELIKKLRGYNVFYERSQDLDLWLRFSNIGKMSCLNIPLVKIRVHNSRISNSDGGYKQFIYSTIARISYWYSKLYNTNPISINEINNHIFIENIYKIYPKDRYMSFNNKMHTLKKSINEKSIFKLFFFVFLNVGFIFEIIKRNYFGSLSVRNTAKYLFQLLNND